MAETKPLAKSLDGQLRGAAAGLAARVRQMTPSQRMRWGGLAALGVALLAGLFWYGTRTDWRTLYAGLNPDDARTMAGQLTTAGIPFEVSPDGTALEVPAQDLDKARLTVTASGGPSSGRMGFALFDKPNWVGSDFDEQVNYQRALEGELEQTIDTLDDVRSSRVNLVMPHDSLFTSEQRAAKASVVLRLKHRTLSDEEARAIRNLVAAAVDGLTPANVVLVSANGEDQFGAHGQNALELAQEQALTQQVISTLQPVAGLGNVHAAVHMDFDTATTSETDEIYNPNQTATLSMQRSSQSTGSQPVAAGVPGAASNAPNSNATGKPPLYPPQAAGQQNSQEESSTYGVSKKIEHRAQGPGTLNRLTVAVVLNEPWVMQGKKKVWQPRSAAEMQRLTQLVQAAVGYNQTRGDIVTVEQMPFDTGSQTPLSFEERAQSWMRMASPLLRPAALLLGILLVVLMVFRPMLKAAAAAGKALPAGVSVKAVIGDTTAEGMAELPQADRQQLQAQAVYERVAERVNKEPAQSARLLQSWIHSE
jgi:flagellar M-ring protein FliF